MSDQATPITPETRVAELLDAYPNLEEKLVAAAPAFRKLKNPILRRTITKVTTLKRAAEMAEISSRDLVSMLRKAAGLPVDEGDVSEGLGADPSTDGPVAWVDASRVRWTVDADGLLDSGQEPIGPVLKQAAGLRGDDLGLIRSSFRPAPLLEKLESQGYRVAVVKSEGGFATFVGVETTG